MRREGERGFGIVSDFWFGQLFTKTNTGVEADVGVKREKGRVLDTYLVGKTVNKKPTDKLNIRLWQVLGTSCSDRL